MAGVDNEAVGHTHLRTSSPEHAREVIASLYGSQLRVDSADPERFRVAIDQVSLGGASVGIVDLHAALRFRIVGGDHFAFGTLRAGTAEHGDDGARFGRGDLFIGVTPGLDEPCRTDHACSRTVQLPARLLDEVAGASPDGPADGWRFQSRRPSPGGAARWNGVVRVFERLIDDPQRAGAPLVINAGLRLLAATALDVFPNTAVVAPDRTDAHDAQPSTVQRAIAFIEANPELDITVADIARAAYVSIRAIQLAFRRQLGTTPTAYLRRVRLSHAHEELENATSGDRLTVTRVALRWGFSSVRGFTDMYRLEYGRSPSETMAGSVPPAEADVSDRPPV